VKTIKKYRKISSQSVNSGDGRDKEEILKFFEKNNELIQAPDYKFCLLSELFNSFRITRKNKDDFIKDDNSRIKVFALF